MAVRGLLFQLLLFWFEWWWWDKETNEWYETGQYKNVKYTYIKYMYKCRVVVLVVIFDTSWWYDYDDDSTHSLIVSCNSYSFINYYLNEEVKGGKESNLFTRSFNETLD